MSSGSSALLFRRCLSVMFTHGLIMGAVTGRMTCGAAKPGPAAAALRPCIWVGSWNANSEPLSGWISARIRYTSASLNVSLNKKELKVNIIIKPMSLIFTAIQIILVKYSKLK